LFFRIFPEYSGEESCDKSNEMGEGLMNYFRENKWYLQKIIKNAN